MLSPPTKRSQQYEESEGFASKPNCDFVDKALVNLTQLLARQAAQRYFSGLVSHNKESAEKAPVADVVPQCERARSQEGRAND